MTKENTIYKNIKTGREYKSIDKSPSIGDEVIFTPSKNSPELKNKDGFMLFFEEPAKVDKKISLAETSLEASLNKRKTNTSPLASEEINDLLTIRKYISGRKKEAYAISTQNIVVVESK